MMRSSRRGVRATTAVGLVAALTTLLSLSAVAQEPPGGQKSTEDQSQSQESPYLSRALAEEKDPSKIRVLSLHDCILMALHNNLGIQADQIRSQTVVADQYAEYGIFDPVFFANGTYRDFEFPTAARTDTGDTGGGSDNVAVVTGNDTNVDMGIRQRLFTGMVAELLFDGSRSVSTSFNQGLNPEYLSNLGVSIRQPLLRGAWDAGNTSQIRIAEGNVQISNSQFRQVVQNTVFEVIQAYWNLVFAFEDVRVVAESFDLAVEQVKVTRSKVESGLWAGLELDQALSAQYSREAELEQARKALRDSEDALRTLIYSLHDEEEWSMRLVPAKRAGDGGELELPEWREEANIALRQRPELTQARIDIENKRLALVQAKADSLPRLDLAGSWTYHGLSDKLGETLNRSFSLTENRTWTAGFEFEVPIGNRVGRAGVVRAELDIRRSRILLKDLENQAIADVRESIRQIQTTHENIQSTHEALRYAERQLNAAKSRRDRGFLTNFEVLQFQQDLTSSQRDYESAKKDFEVALVGLELAKGTLLDYQGLGMQIVVLDE